MEFSYLKNTEKYDALKAWAKDTRMWRLYCTSEDLDTKWKQFHLEIFHFKAGLQTPGTSQEIRTFNCLLRLLFQFDYIHGYITEESRTCFLYHYDRINRIHNWDVNKLSIEECNHSYKTDCLMMRDMVTIVQLVYNKLIPSDSSPSELLQALKPKMTVVGSVAEGTRLVLGNEMDLLMEFPELKGAFEIRNDDPFHLYCTSKTSPFLRHSFFNSKEEFLFHKFKAAFLMELDKALEDIFEQGRNPPRLRRGNWKDHLQKGTFECNDCRDKMKGSTLLEQCSNGSCMATVAQSKTGFCLQFEWIDDDGQPFYCSIDLVPVFPIEDKNPMDLARIINSAMRMRNHPPGWFHQMRKYEVCDRIVKGINTPDVTSVVLKTMNCLEDKNYFIRPGQPLGWDKFPNNKCKDYYLRIKLVIKAKGIKNMGNYMVKKLLLKPEFEDMDLEYILKHEGFKVLSDIFD